MSRFLYQLKYESPFNITEKSLRYDININPPKEIRIEKTPEIQKILRTYLSSSKKGKYLSPSGLSNYLRCKLKFYFSYVAGLKEQDEITEEIDAPLFGNILHEAMDNLYQHLKGKTVLPETLSEILKDKQQITASIDHAFNKNYFKNHKADYSGKNIIIREIIEKYVKQLIKKDAEMAPFKILSLEDTCQIKIPFKLNDAIEMVKLGGKIDRVDKQNNRIRIIDYKTGNDTLDYKNIEALFSDKKSDQRSAVFQTFLYSKFYHDLKKPELPVVPGVYSVKHLFDNTFEYRIYNKETKSYINNYNEVDVEYLQHLTHLIEEIFNPKIAFTQTEETSHCQYCPYQKICHR
jgi:CRISPR/Cas system-associated exonuclease Cas4 (RecB family)